MHQAELINPQQLIRPGYSDPQLAPTLTTVISLLFQITANPWFLKELMKIGTLRPKTFRIFVLLNISDKPILHHLRFALYKVQN